MEVRLLPSPPTIKTDGFSRTSADSAMTVLNANEEMKR